MKSETKFKDFPNKNRCLLRGGSRLLIHAHGEVMPSERAETGRCECTETVEGPRTEECHTVTCVAQDYRGLS